MKEPRSLSFYLRCLAEVTSIASLLFQTWLMERRETQLLFQTSLMERRSSSFPPRPFSLFNHPPALSPSLAQAQKHIIWHSRNKITQIINEYSNPKKLNLITVRAITGYGSGVGWSLSLSFLSLTVCLSLSFSHSNSRHAQTSNRFFHPGTQFTAYRFRILWLPASQKWINDMSTSARKNSLWFSLLQVWA